MRGEAPCRPYRRNSRPRGQKSGGGCLFQICRSARSEDVVFGARLIREQKPHILFTDIRMPGDDGLTMLAGLRSEFPELQVVVLTGYRDFSYAQEAIRLGVTRFLLKPSKLDEIREELSAITEKLRRESGADAAHFARVFKKVAGMSANEYRNSL